MIPVQRKTCDDSRMEEIARKIILTSATAWSIDWHFADKRVVQAVPAVKPFGERNRRACNWEV
jgi:hypothetical protein